MAEADSTVEMFVNLKPILRDSAMRDVEKHCQRTKHGISRRMLLGILTKTGEELIEAALAAPEAMRITELRNRPDGLLLVIYQGWGLLAASPLS